ITDGQENASVEYDSRKVKEMIGELEQSKNWQFIYLGADLKNFADAETLGLSHKVSSRKSDLKQKFDVIAEHSVKIMMAEPDEDKYKMMKDFVDDLGKEAD
ncbi:MAG: hypothetical protein M0Q12_10505, partial [Synergistaceae bacterium]|nr:hypothetical protein [Synergistaceae bacterium]